MAYYEDLINSWHHKLNWVDPKINQVITVSPTLSLYWNKPSQSERNQKFYFARNKLSSKLPFCFHRTRAPSNNKVNKSIKISNLWNEAFKGQRQEYLVPSSSCYWQKPENYGQICDGLAPWCIKLLASVSAHKYSTYFKWENRSDIFLTVCTSFPLKRA